MSVTERRFDRVRAKPYLLPDGRAINVTYTVDVVGFVGSTRSAAGWWVDIRILPETLEIVDEGQPPVSIPIRIDQP